MPLEDDSPASELVLQAIAAVELPAPVRAAWAAQRPAVAAGQLWRAHVHDINRFVVILQTEGALAEVAPVTVDVDLATDDAYLLEAAESDFDVPVAVWLAVKDTIPVRVLEQYVGGVHFAVDALRKAPHGRPLVSALDDRAMEVAILRDDMEELAAAAATEVTLQELLSRTTVKQLVDLQIPTPHALELFRGRRALTPEQAAKVAELVGTTAEVLLRANPPLPPDLLQDLDAPELRELVSQLAEQRGLSQDEARLTAGYGAYALAARQAGAGEWSSRLAAYLRARLSE